MCFNRPLGDGMYIKKGYSFNRVRFMCDSTDYEKVYDK